jgi:ABC-type multidrug transport system ATPase subunit
MRARVGFSIATSVDPDILLLDEVLGTGDNKFKKKSKIRIANVLKSAKAVVMVTHDMSWITSFCTRAILLDRGRIVADGDPVEIVEMHGADAAIRKMQKRKAKQLMMHGKISTTDINKALKAGTMGDLLAGHEEDLAEIDREKAEKRAALEEKRGRKRAEQKAAGEPVDDEPDGGQEDEEHAELTAADTPADELLAEAKAESREEADADEQVRTDDEALVGATTTDAAEADESEADPERADPDPRLTL